MLIHTLLLDSAKKYPDKEAIKHRDKEKTYAALYEEATLFSHWISDRNKNTFRAAILSDDPFDYICTYFAILMAGGTVVALNTQTTVRSVEKIINDCTPALFFIDEKFNKYIPQSSDIPSVKDIVVRRKKKVLPISDNLTYTDFETITAPENNISQRKTIPCSPEDIAQIIYTSGTTGSPKGVMLTHANLLANTRSIIKYLNLTVSDRIMAVLPFFYSYGNSVMLTHLAVGATLVVNQNFLYPNIILKEMASEKVTGFSGVPSTFALLLNRSAIADYAFPHLRYITQAGASMSPKLASRLSTILPGVDIFIMYGQTEASARLSYLKPEKLHSKAGSIGKAIPGVVLKLLNRKGQPVRQGEVGEIVARGDNIMTGYWKNHAATKKVLRNNWLWTGDLAKQDEEGFFYIVSRKSDIIKSGSHRIGPKEIEDILHGHPSIHEAAVKGVKDNLLGEAIKAYLVLKKGRICSQKDISRYCRKNLASFKVPKFYSFYEDLPKTATGKIQKGKLI